MLHTHGKQSHISRVWHTRIPRPDIADAAVVFPYTVLLKLHSTVIIQGGNTAEAADASLKKVTTDCILSILIAHTQDRQPRVAAASTPPVKTESIFR